MKNTIKLFGIIAIVAVIIFSMAACDDGSGNGGGGNDNGNGNNNHPIPTLTIHNTTTFISSVAVYRYTTVPTTAVEFWANVEADGFLAVGRGNSSPMLLDKVTRNESGNAIRVGAFTETGSYIVRVDIGTPPTIKFTVAHFTNGSATVDWNTMTPGSSLP